MSGPFRRERAVCPAIVKSIRSDGDVGGSAEAGTSRAAQAPFRTLGRGYSPPRRSEPGQWAMTGAASGGVPAAGGTARGVLTRSVRTPNRPRTVDDMADKQ